MLQNDLELHEFVVASAHSMERPLFQEKLAAMTESSDLKHAWVRYRCSTLGRVTATVFEEAYLRPFKMKDPVFTATIMNALSPYFKTGVQVEVVLPDYATLPGVTVHSRLVGL